MDYSKIHITYNNILCSYFSKLVSQKKHLNGSLCTEYYNIRSSGVNMDKAIMEQMEQSAPGTYF